MHAANLSEMPDRLDGSAIALFQAQKPSLPDIGLNLGLKVAGQKVIFQENAVLQGLVPALNFALSLQMARGATHMGRRPAFGLRLE